MSLVSLWREQAVRPLAQFLFFVGIGQTTSPRRHSSWAGTVGAVREAFFAPSGLRGKSRHVSARSSEAGNEPRTNRVAGGHDDRDGTGCLWQSDTGIGTWSKPPG